MKWQMIQPTLISRMRDDDLCNFVRGITVPAGKKVLFVVDDPTRPSNIMAQLVMDYFLDTLSDKEVSILVASGMHRQPTMKELRLHLGNIVDKVPVHRHNPYFSLEDYVQKCFSDYFIVSIGTCMPHTFMGISGAGKIFSPGLDNVETVCKFHNLDERMRKDYVMLGLGIADYFVNTIINKFGQPTNVIGSPKGLWTPTNMHDFMRLARDSYEIDLPEPTNAAILIPWFKNSDLMQCLNAVTVCQQKPVVAKGGVLAFDCTQAKDGIGVHYAFQPFNGMKQVKYDEVWSDLFDGIELAFITNDIPLVAIQELFQRDVKVFSNLENFELYINGRFGHGCPVNVYQGADMMIGV
jgi:hypothetical protein